MKAHFCFYSSLAGGLMLALAAYVNYSKWLFCFAFGEKFAC